MANEKSKKAKVLTSVAAVALAASMLIGGGTYAYLQGKTEDVVNNFDTNEVTVDLTETTGSNYEIIPGTTQAKDPKVTVNATVDAYVYVTVDDATDGLVTYTMADGWTQLEGYDNVYYREVTASDAAQEFDVLAGNQVSYDAALTNTDMVDAEGNLKEGLELTFCAYAIQKEPFNDPAAAYVGKDTSFAETWINLNASMSTGKNVALANDITLQNNIGVNHEKSSVVDLNGKTITLAGKNGYLQLASFDTALTVKGKGNIVVDPDSSETGFVFWIKPTCSTSVLNIEDGHYLGGISVVYADSDTVTVNISGGTFETIEGSQIVNVRDGCKATINITGGTFKNFDPSNNTLENPAVNWVPEGYKVVSETIGSDTWYTVVKA